MTGRYMDSGYQYLASLWLREASEIELKDELKDCRNSPTLQGEAAARLIQMELNRRQTSHE
jgi:hypothetical protein